MSGEKNHKHRLQTAAMAEQAGLMLLVALGLVGCFWLALLLAFRKDAVNQRHHLGSLGGGQLK